MSDEQLRARIRAEAVRRAADVPTAGTPSPDDRVAIAAQRVIEAAGQGERNKAARVVLVIDTLGDRELPQWLVDRAAEWGIR